MTRYQCETIGHTWHRKTCVICGAFDEDREFDPELEPIVAGPARTLDGVTFAAKLAGAIHHDPVEPLACFYCAATGRPLDLDVAHVPPVHSCRKCMRVPICTRCNVRRGRVNLDGVCCRCVRLAEAARKRRETVRCTACRDKTNVGETNDHGECGACSTARMYRENPITRSNA